MFAASQDSAILSEWRALLPICSPHCYMLTPDVSLPLTVLSLPQSLILEITMSPLFLPSLFKSVRLCMILPFSVFIVIVI